MKKTIVNFLARILPDYCPFETKITYKGILLVYIPPICKINFLYKDIMKRKLELKGYDKDLLDDL